VYFVVLSAYAARLYKNWVRKCFLCATAVSVELRVRQIAWYCDIEVLSGDVTCSLMCSYLAGFMLRAELIQKISLAFLAADVLLLYLLFFQIG